MKICSCKYRACESSSRLQYVQTLEYIACFQLHLNFDHNKKKSQKVAMETRDYDYSVALVAVILTADTIPIGTCNGFSAV